VSAMTDVRDRLRTASDAVTPPGDPFERLAKRRDRRRRRGRLATGAFALVLAGGVLGGTLFALNKAGREHGTARPGAFGTSTAPALGDGQYLYIRWTNVHPGSGFVMQTWWASDGSGKVAASCTDPTCADHYGFPPQGTFGPGQFPADSDLRGLSTDPATLKDQLVTRTAPGGNSPEPPVSPGPDIAPGVTEGGLLYAIDSILQDPNGSPDLKAAVFEVARTVSSVKEHSGTDPAGRPAIVLTIAYGTPQLPSEYFFDPTSHLLMAISSSDAVYQLYDQGIVSSTDAVPTGEQWLFAEAPGR
jgi:hypothetical protein